MGIIKEEGEGRKGEGASRKVGRRKGEGVKRKEGGEKRDEA